MNPKRPSLPWSTATVRMTGVRRSILRDEQDAEDAFQATFLVLRKAGKLWTNKSLGAWLYGVAFRTASCARSSRDRASKNTSGGPRNQCPVPSLPRLGMILARFCTRRSTDCRNDIAIRSFSATSRALHTASRTTTRLAGRDGPQPPRPARALLRDVSRARGLAPETASLAVVCGKIVAPPDRLIELTVKAATLRAARNDSRPGWSRLRFRQ